MSDSASDADPRFRIPRGDSDEEIDSDLASVSSLAEPSGFLSHLLSAASPAASPPLPALLPSLNPSGPLLTPPSTPPPEDADHSRAPSDAGADDADPDADVDADTHAEALASVTFAATGRRDLTNAAAKAARRVLPAGPEASHPVGAGAAAAAPGAGPRTQSDMMARMLRALDSADAVPARLGALKKKVARLSAGGKAALPVPLPEPVAGRLERAAAYGHAADDVTQRWAGVVQRNRKARKLVFPMNAPGEVVRTSGNVAARVRAENEYEREIGRLLREAGVVHEAQVVGGEEKELNGLDEAGVSKAQVMERRRELARTRALMFHYERKMKRIKKIKSRKFRRIMKKEKEGLEGTTEEDAIGAERRRVEERMRLRHKNTSKWVRRQLSRGEDKRNPDTRAAIEEQLQLHQDLKRRQEGVMENGDESDSDASLADGAEERLEEELEEMGKELEREGQVKKPRKKGVLGMKFMQVAEERKRKEAQALLDEMDDNADNDSDSDAASGRLDDVVQKGRQTFAGSPLKDNKGERKRRRGPASEAGAEISDGDEVSSDGEEEKEAESLKQRVIEEYEEGEKTGAPLGPVDRNGKFSEIVMKTSETRPGFTTILGDRLKAASDNPWLTRVTSGQEKVKSVAQGGASAASELERPSEEALKVHGSETQRPSPPSSHKPVALLPTNPWLARVPDALPDEENAPGGGHESRAVVGDSRKENEIRVFGGDGKATPTPLGGKRRVHFTTTDEEEGNSKKQKGKNKRNVNGTRAKTDRAPFQMQPSSQVLFGSDEEREGRDDSEDELARMSEVAKAFAGIGGADEADFQAAKETDVSQALPTAKDIGAEVLPGWGAWDGAGMRKRERKESAFARAARERLEAARKGAIAKRKDRNMSHVILDERRVKQAAELTLASVPFPFTSAQQWQREVGTPVCRELVTGNAFAAGVAPRVQKKAGVAIEPLRHGALVDKKRKRQWEERQEAEREREANKVKTGAKGGRGRKGKKGVIDLRKEKASKRNAARKGLMS